MHCRISDTPVDALRLASLTTLVIAKRPKHFRDLLMSVAILKPTTHRPAGIQSKHPDWKLD